MRGPCLAAPKRSGCFGGREGPLANGRGECGTGRLKLVRGGYYKTGQALFVAAVFNHFGRDNQI